MPTDDVSIRIRVQNAREAAAEARKVEHAVGGIGTTAHTSSTKGAKGMGVLSGGMAKIGLVAGGASVGGYALAGALKHLAEMGRESHLVSKQTATVLRSTGADAWISSKGVEGLAAKLSLMSGTDAEVIQKGEDMLLTFRAVRDEAGKGNDIFSHTTRTALDMSAAFQSAGKKMSLTSAMVLLGKAINDPVKGMARLARVGVTFTAQQQDHVKKLVATGHAMEAQKLILADLDKRYAGSAKAQADPMKRVTAAWHLLEIKLGKGLLPVLEKIAIPMAKFLGQMATGTGEGGKIMRVMSKVAHVVGGVLGAAFRGAGKVVSGVIQTMTGVITVFDGLLHGNWSKVWGGLKGIVSGALHSVLGVIQVFTAPVAGAASALWGGFKTGIVTAINFVIGAIRKVVGIYNQTLGLVTGKMTLPDFIGDKSPGAKLAKSFKDIANATAGVNPTGGTYNPNRQRATGGLVQPGEHRTLVGENGPEVVDLPPGSRVHSNAESRGMGVTHEHHWRVYLGDREVRDAVVRAERAVQARS